MDEERPTILDTHIGDPQIPKPIGSDGERATLTRLIEFADSGQSPTLQNVRSLGVSFTPWIAQQLGSLAEGLIADGDISRATQVAMLSVLAAREADDPHQLQANRLTAGNIYLKYGMEGAAWARDVARQLYEAIIDSPFAAARNERIGAHLGLANYYDGQNDANAAYQAALHYDQFLPFLDQTIKGPAREAILRQATKTYLKCSDSAGALFCLSRLGDRNADRLEHLLKTADDLSLDQALLTIARLRGLGDQEMAAKIYSAWVKSGRLHAGSTIWHKLSSRMRSLWPWKFPRQWRANSSNSPRATRKAVQ